MGKSVIEKLKAYEQRTDTKLSVDMPIILRIGGKSFKTLTKNCDKPFDDVVARAMYKTMLELCKNIPYCVLGYTYSDEITLLIVNKGLDGATPWYENRAQKLCSVTASMATAQFCKFFVEYTKLYNRELSIDLGLVAFDCRCFNILENDVIEYFIWRQKACVRHAVMGIAHTMYSNKELYKKSDGTVRKMIKEKTGKAFAGVEPGYCYGFCAVRRLVRLPSLNVRNMWTIDKDVPKFWREPMYIQDCLYVK